MINTILKTFLFALWLPVLVVAVSLARFGADFFSSRPEAFGPMTLQLALGWVAAFPLTLALTLVKPHSRGWLVVCAVVLAPLTVLAFIMGGLFGAAGAVVAMLVVSLPAWLVYLVLRLRRSRGGRGQ